MSAPLSFFPFPSFLPILCSEVVLIVARCPCMLGLMDVHPPPPFIFVQRQNEKRRRMNRLSAIFAVVKPVELTSAATLNVLRSALLSSVRRQDAADASVPPAGHTPRKLKIGHGGTLDK